MIKQVDERLGTVEEHMSSVREEMRREFERVRGDPLRIPALERNLEAVLGKLDQLLKLAVPPVVPMVVHDQKENVDPSSAAQASSTTVEGRSGDVLWELDGKQETDLVGWRCRFLKVRIRMAGSTDPSDFSPSIGCLSRRSSRCRSSASMARP